jgi:hypothetical protein
MCRSIKTLYNFEPPATDDEVRKASLQFVRKLCGFTKPSKANEAAFEAAVEQVAGAAQTLLASLVTNASPRNREVEAVKARAKARRRFPAEETAGATQGDPISITAHRGGHQKRSGSTDVPIPPLMKRVVRPRGLGAANSKRP